MQQTQMQDTLPQELKAFSLHAGPISSIDMEGIKDVIQQVLSKISDNKKSSAQTRGSSNIEPFVSGVLIFQDWLKQQECINDVTIPFVEPSGEYSGIIFSSYPGEVPINIFFNSGTEQTVQYRLLVYVGNPDIIKFASFIENNK